MYLNYLLNPGSLSYLPTNGPVVRHSTLRCHSSLKLRRDEQVRLLDVGKVVTDTPVAHRSRLRAQDVSQRSNRTEQWAFIFTSIAQVRWLGGAVSVLIKILRCFHCGFRHKPSKIAAFKAVTVFC